MRALRWTLVGIVLAIFALFAFSNWTPVPLVLPDGARVLVPLPIIVFGAFLIGWLPLLLLHTASRATWRRRIAKVERALDETLTPRTVALPLAATPIAMPMPAPVVPPVADPLPSNLPPAQ